LCASGASDPRAEPGGRTAFASFSAVPRPCAYLLLCGDATGPVPPVYPIKLLQKGSLFLTRPTVAHYIATREELEQQATDVLNMVSNGKLKLRIGHVYKLHEAQQAHRDLEGRKTTGKLLLIP